MSDEYLTYEKKTPGISASGHLLKLWDSSPTPLGYRDFQVQRAGSLGRRSQRRPFKRTFDLVLALFGTALLMPLLLGIAIAIKLTSKGPVLFHQHRYGLFGRTFRTYKFRTMYLDACDESGRQQTTKDDPRVTPVGRFLRRTNFDELPQLLNVIRGDMSLVGPRPHVPGMLAAGVPYEEFDQRYMARHRVLPGITGLAQVKGWRGETTDPHAAKMRLEYDLEYIENQSMLLDVKILAKTVVSEFVRGSGY
ncbi:sugar transferase [Roseibium sediminis]|uniref:sugar transferase n=1 Tax=Roseibium sediminis TaxID=1775174 RepID=UPI00123DEAA4|nr:sugar transferase [Roseibium sediminis]